MVKNMKKHKESDNKDFFDKIQESLDREMEKYYSKKTIRYFKNPVHFGRLEDANGKAEMKGGCGDIMEMSLNIKDEIIREIKFYTDGCGVTVACGSAVAELVKGKTLAYALKISPDFLMNELDGVPRDSIHCTILSVCTMHKAIADYLLKTE